MFFSKVVTDKYGHSEKDLYLTQGDTATITSVPKQNGVLIDFTLIDKCIFKISDYEYKEIFQKECEELTDKYSVTLESEETFDLPIDTLRYEVEYTFIDGTVNTPNQGKFIVLDQVRQ